MTHSTDLTKSKVLRRRLARLLLVVAVPMLAIGTSKGAWVDQVRVEARVTFAPRELPDVEPEATSQSEPPAPETEPPAPESSVN